MKYEFSPDLPKHKEEYQRNLHLIVKAEQENEILARQIQRLENLDEYYKRGERAKRAHRLITKGAAIENIWPASKEIEDADFYQLMQKVLTSADTAAILKAYKAEHPNPEEGGDG